MCDANGRPIIRADHVWLSFMIRYHRTEVTLRETVVRILDRFRRNGHRDGRWRQVFWALQDVSLEVYPGEVVGIVGRNGSGKTTLLKTLAGICTPDRGTVEVHGRMSCLMSFGIGFKPNLSGRENVYLNGSILGLSRREITERMNDIIAFSELGEFVDAPVQTYSAGMRSRLGFSIAIHIEPDVLLLDEVLSAGDAGFRAKAGSILDRIRAQGRTVVIASHSMALMERSCTKVIWLERGQVRMIGTPQEVTTAYCDEFKVEKKVQDE